MTEASERGPDSLLIETIGADPLVVSRNGRVREFRKLRNELRGNDLSTAIGVVDRVRKSRAPEQGPGHAAFPIISPDGAVAGVHITLGTGPRPEPPRVGASYWELATPTEVPRLHLSTEILDIMGTPLEYRDRSIYGPFDFCGPIVRTRDLLLTWEQIASAAPGSAEVGQFVLRGAGGKLVALQYAHRYVDTDVGPRLRGIVQDVTDQIDTAELALDLVDAGITSTAITATGQFGALVDFRGTWPVVLKWLTPLMEGAGHGVSTGQAPGLHPEDMARIPELIGPALQGETVVDKVRTRNPAGGWIWSEVVARQVDPVTAPTVGLVLFTPGHTEATAQPPGHLPLPLTEESATRSS
ncbi:GAF domain-containing protein [Nocardia sp. NPDC050435]|uniref:GAF domain-containing protein n=1 Tax=Nocardia sp. NPDC050435 TaxID=3155040 RepID=UPI0033D0B290